MLLQETQEVQKSTMLDDFIYELTKQNDNSSMLVSSLEDRLHKLVNTNIEKDNEGEAPYIRGNNDIEYNLFSEIERMININTKLSYQVDKLRNII